MTVQRRMRLAAIALMALLMALFTPLRTVSGQELRGTVREAAAGIPIPGAVLLMLDSSGAPRARNITDEHGVYRIAAAAWMRRLRVVRIGFRPTEIELPPIGQGIVTTDVEMVVIPVLLEPVRVKAGAQCPKRADRLAALSLLEQARAGLLATIVAREAKPAAIVRVHFTSHLRDTSDEVEDMAVRIDSTDTSKVSFVASRSAGDFVREGFAIQHTEAATFDGPDAETLLDDDFRDGYCFQLREGEAKRPNQVGLGFVAATARRGRVDIDGTLWIDTVARQLKDVQFKYANLPLNIQAVQPGGQIRFRELANGVVIIDRWSLRLPAPAEYAAITRAQILANSSYRGVLDSNGVTTIEGLVPGPYSAVMRDTEMDSIQIGLKTTLRFSIASNETIDTQTTVPTATNYVESRCRASSITPTEPGDFLIIGRTFDSSDKPVGPTAWKLSRRNADFVDTWNATTAADGIFEFCGNQFRLGDEVAIEARRSPADSSVSRVLHLTRRLTVVRITLPDLPR